MAFGPHFVEELAAAGLLVLPFAWGADGSVTYSASITTAQRAAIQAVIAAHNPATPASDIDAVRDAYVLAKAAVEAMVANPTDAALARTALVRTAQCLEELLKALNRRIA